MGYLFITCMHFGVQSQTLLGYCDTAPCGRHTSFYKNILDGLSAADFLRGISSISSLTAVGSWEILLERVKGLHSGRMAHKTPNCMRTGRANPCFVSQSRHAAYPLFFKAVPLLSHFMDNRMRPLVHFQLMCRGARR